MTLPGVDAGKLVHCTIGEFYSGDGNSRGDFLYRMRDFAFLFCICISFSYIIC